VAPSSPGRRSRRGWWTQLHLFLAPIVVGGGKRFLPDHVRVELELEDQRRFANGMVFLPYRTKR
jgi:dihydrofolate reductase